MILCINIQKDKNKLKERDERSWHYLLSETWCQVRAAVSALKDVQCLPKLPRDLVPPGRSPDMLDFLLHTFGFQVGVRSILPYFYANPFTKFNDYMILSI